ncbi:YraN family protein [Bailinhaonella thermotolerans]|uniref:UPF0102 protein D5H75_37140 n=1 Tax=Bailinhaonella thermotolerans TaxID=1070861 RepID=A0A3A4A2H1_9ACTN|nr:YraN family protein [Bailinhaonella thermotolerans]RJL21758.1 YraN family protein [Bailinhaonella thermotolerans]
MGVKDELGRFGEKVAADFLGSIGYSIIERNWRCRSGEIDIVAREGDALVVVEVKTRSGRGYGTPAESVTYTKARRLRGLAAQWARGHEGGFARIRIDVIAIERDPRGGTTLRHLPGVI